MDLPSFSSNFFLARVSADLGSGYYAGEEYWLTGGASTPTLKTASGRYFGALNPGRAIDGSTLAVGDWVLARSADGEGGLKFELVSLRAGTSSVGDVIGPHCAPTGAVAIFTDPSGRFVGPAQTLQYDVLQYDSQFSGGTTTIRLLTLFADPAPPPAVGRATTSRTVSFVTESYSGPVGFWGSSGSHVNTTLATRLFQQLSAGADFDSVGSRVYFDADGHVLGHQVTYQIANGAASGSFEIWNNAGTVVQSPIGIQIWQVHYSSDGTPGITGSCTVKVGGVDKTLSFKDGIIVGLA